MSEDDSPQKSLWQRHGAWAIGIGFLVAVLAWLSWDGHPDIGLLVYVVTLAGVHRWIDTTPRLSEKAKQNLVFAVLGLGLLGLLWMLTGLNNQAMISIVLTILIFALFALGLNLQFGYTGIINFGHVAFMGIGAYTVAIVVQRWFDAASVLERPADWRALALVVLLAVVAIGIGWIVTVVTTIGMRLANHLKRWILVRLRTLLPTRPRNLLLARLKKKPVESREAVPVVGRAPLVVGVVVAVAAALGGAIFAPWPPGSASMIALALSVVFAFLVAGVFASILMGKYLAWAQRVRTPQRQSGLKTGERPMRPARGTQVPFWSRGFQRFWRLVRMAWWAVVRGSWRLFVRPVQGPPRKRRRLEAIAGGTVGALIGIIVVLVVPWPLTPMWATAYFLSGAAVLGMILAAIFGLFLGLPTLRLRLDYLAIVTIGAAEILRRVWLNEAWLTNGPLGIRARRGERPFDAAVREWDWPGHLAGALDIVSVYTLLLGIILLAVVLFVYASYEVLSRSPYGRVLRAVREDEDLAKGLGKNVFLYKLQVLAIGSAVAALAGAFLLWQQQFIDPNVFHPLITFYAWIIIVVGGAGNNKGTILGAVVLWTLFEATRFLNLQENLGLSGTQAGALRVALIGLLLILLMLFKPEGILGKREELVLGD